MFRKAHRAALIHELQSEVADHHGRLDRAANGLSPAFVPTGGEHVRIDAEHTHLDALRNAVFELGQAWSVKQPRAGWLSVRRRKTMLTQAIGEVAGLETGSAEASEASMWHALRTYLVAKRSCTCVELGQSHTWQYSTLGQDFGYAMRVCKPVRR